MSLPVPRGREERAVRDTLPEADARARKPSSRIARVVAAIIVIAIGIPMPVAASHMTTCRDTAQVGFAAQKKVRSGEVRAVSGELENQVLYTCTFAAGEDPPGRVTWQWVAIEGACGGSGNCIMQIGIGRGSNSETMGWWWAWGRSSSAPGCTGRPSRSPGAVRFADWNSLRSTFQVVYVEGGLVVPAYWSFRINGSQKKVVSDDDICWAPTALDWFGETLNRGSAIGGTQADPFLIAEVRYRIPGDATWYGPGWSGGTLCDIENPKPPYHCQKIDSDSLWNWTQR